MPRNVSFAWTAPAFIARQKTCTRRDWKPEYASRFRKGDIITASDRVLFLPGASLIGTARLTHDVTFQSTAAMPATDWEAEGFHYLESIGATVNSRTPRQLWEEWLTTPRELAVIRFEILTVQEPLHA